MPKEIYNEYLRLLAELEEYNATKIPLCAAETFCSPFVKSALNSEFEGKYCMHHLSYDMPNDFVGSHYVHKLYNLLARQCKKMFNCAYADARPLSGLNCISLVINATLPRGSKVLLTTAEQGGHPSIPLILDLAGIEFDEIPYDYHAVDINYELLNQLLSSDDYDGIIIAQSDLLMPADISKIKARNKLTIYDATQTLGFIATQLHKNPLDSHDNLTLIGGTHKTLPGPTAGLVLLRNDNLISTIDSFISPSYLRNTQPNNIAGVLLALLEMEQFGRDYLLNTVKNGNILGQLLSEAGFRVIQLSNGSYTTTHQIFVSVTKDEKDIIVRNAHKYAVTLNGKEKKLFGGHGIRLGLQEITRYGWGKEEMCKLIDLMKELRKSSPNANVINEIKHDIGRRKNAYFVFDN